MFGVVLVERAIDANKNFLGQILGGVRPRREAVGEIVDAPRIVLDNLFPGRAIARATPPDQIGPTGRQRPRSPHLLASPIHLALKTANSKMTSPCYQPFTRCKAAKFHLPLQRGIR